MPGEAVEEGMNGKSTILELSGKCEGSCCHTLLLMRNIPENCQGVKCHEYICKCLFSCKNCIIYRKGKLMQLSVCVSRLIHTLADFRETRKNCWTHAPKESVILYSVLLAGL